MLELSHSIFITASTTQTIYIIVSITTTLALALPEFLLGGRKELIIFIDDFLLGEKA